MSNAENQNYIQQRDRNTKVIRRVSVITLAFNVALTVLKAVFGAVFFNVSVLSDAIHSLSDVGTTVLVLIAVVISKPQSDKKHNYGHEKVEPLIVQFFAVVLGAVGVLLVVQGIRGIIAPKAVTLNYYLLGVTVLSVVSKEAMYWYTIHFARKISSNTLKADAWHHRSDSLSSIAVLIGLIVGIFTRNDLAESIAVLFVAALVIKVAVQILILAINQLIDRAADDKTVDDLKSIASGVENVESIDKFQTRLFGNAIYIDVEIGVRSDMTVEESHQIAQGVHDSLENQTQYPVKHCNVHVNPCRCDGKELE